MSYTTVFTFNPSATADTAVVTGANSTGAVPGLTDYKGGVWQVKNGTVFSASSGDTLDPPKSSLYDAAHSLKNGRARGIRIVGEHLGLTLRLNPTTGDGYTVTLFYGDRTDGTNQLRIDKMVGGNISRIYGPTILAVPQNCEYCASILDTAVGVTVIRFDAFALNDTIRDPTTSLATYTYIDTDNPIQAPGYFGYSPFFNATFGTLTIEQYDEGGAIVITPPSILKTEITASQLSRSIPIGGYLPYTVRMQRTLASTPNAWADIANSSALIFADTGLTAGTSYLYRVAVTDGQGTAAYSAPTALTTVASTGIVLGYAGDSITYGVSDNVNALVPPGPYRVETEFSLRSLGYSVGTNVNAAIGGSRSADYATGGQYHQQMLDLFNQFGVTHAMLRWGSNDVGLLMTTADFQSNMLDVANSIIDNCPSVKYVILNEPPLQYNTGAQTYPITDRNARLAEYRGVLDAVAATNPARIKRGSTTTQADTFAHNPAWYDGDLLHFNHTGHVGIAAGDVARFTSLFPIINSVTVSPVSASVTGGTTYQFSATVSGSGSQSVNWSCDLGSIDSNGLYTAPAPRIDAQEAHVYATSAFDSTKIGAARVTIPAAIPQLTNLTIGEVAYIVQALERPDGVLARGATNGKTPSDFGHGFNPYNN